MIQRKNTKTAYHMKIADLSYDSALSFHKNINKKFNNLLQKVNFNPNHELYISIHMNIKEALYKKFKNLKTLREIFKTNEDCIEFLEELIWRGEPVHPDYPTYKVYKCRDGWYKCKENGAEFNVLTGTLFHSTKIPLPIWFEIIFRLQSDKRGLPASMLVREYGFTYKTAWHILQKIRNAMGKENHQELKGTVEVDEYYEGGILPNMHGNKRWEAKQKPNQGKKLLQGFVERNGDAVINVIPDRTENTVIAGILKYVRLGSIVYTDDYQGYNKLPPIYNRGVVVHSDKIYVNKDNKDIHTNTIESLWAVFERMKKTHIHVSEKHLPNYANEVCFRYNTRDMKNSADACTWFLQNIQDTKITWREIRDAKYTRYNRNQARAA